MGLAGRPLTASDRRSLAQRFVRARGPEECMLGFCPKDLTRRVSIVIARPAQSRDAVSEQQRVPGLFTGRATRPASRLASFDTRPEGCQSGRMGRSRKPKYPPGYRGFESHPLRRPKGRSPRLTFHVGRGLFALCGRIAEGATKGRISLTDNWRSVSEYDVVKMQGGDAPQ